MAEAYRPDGQLNIPTQAAADEMTYGRLGRLAYENTMAAGRARVDAIADKNKNKELKMLLSKATGIEQGPKSLTATRDIVSDFLLNNIYGDDYTKQNAKTVGNFMGGAGQGFLDMGVSDVTVIPGLMDSYDAFNRLQKAKKNDDFTDAEQRSIEASPITLLPLKLAAIAAGAMGNDNAISDYYDGKKGDIVTMYAGPAGLIGISAGVVSLLKKFGRSAIDAPVFGGFLKKSSPKLGTLPE